MMIIILLKELITLLISYAVLLVQCVLEVVLFIFISMIHKIWQFGPYGPNHATAGTFAFRRELLKETRYDDNAEMAEEKKFLKNYTIPFIQLDPKKVFFVLLIHTIHLIKEGF